MSVPKRIVEEAIGELGAVLAQVCASDDAILMEHVRKAHEILRSGMRAADLEELRVLASAPRGENAMSDLPSNGDPNLPPSVTQADIDKASGGEETCIICDEQVAEWMPICEFCANLKNALDDFTSTQEKLRERLKKINTCLTKAFKLARDLQDPNLFSPVDDVIQRSQMAGRLLATLSEARREIPDSIRRQQRLQADRDRTQAATPPEVTT